MGKKRKSGGRSKGQKGRGQLITCFKCGKRVPRDKAKKQTRTTSGVDFRIAKEIRADGGVIIGKSTISYYCISCAIHRGIVRPGRAKHERKLKE